MSHIPVRDAVLQAAGAFVSENFLYTRPGLRLDPDDSLLAGGVVDSLGVMELVEWISSTYGVFVEDEEITEENLGSLGAIARFVSARVGAGERDAA